MQRVGGHLFTHQPDPDSYIRGGDPRYSTRQHIESERRWQHARAEDLYRASDAAASEFNPTRAAILQGRAQRVEDSLLPRHDHALDRRIAATEGALVGASQQYGGDWNLERQPFYGRGQVPSSKLSRGPAVVAALLDMVSERELSHVRRYERELIQPHQHSASLQHTSRELDRLGLGARASVVGQRAAQAEELSQQAGVTDYGPTVMEGLHEMGMGRYSMSSPGAQHRVERELVAMQAAREMSRFV